MERSALLCIGLGIKLIGICLYRFLGLTEGDFLAEIEDLLEILVMYFWVSSRNPMVFLLVPLTFLD